MKKRRVSIVLLGLLFIIGISVMLYCLWFQKAFFACQPVCAQGVSFSLQDKVLETEMSQTVSASMIEAAQKSSYQDNFQTSFQAEAAYVVDETGTVLYAKNEHTKLYPASTTKLMTAYLAIQHTEDLDALITVAPLEGCYEEGSLLLYLKEGDQISMRDLLYGLLLCSYNDAATAIAMEVGGSLEGFSDLMNAQLQKIGAKETHFVTPHGLHHEEHYTTAYDLNLILQMAYSVSQIQEIMLEKEVAVSILREGEELVYTLKNSSFFVRDLYSVPDMTYGGGKTGYTSKAESCLASVFEQDGKRYYSTVMRSEDASYMTTVLFDYYFSPQALAAFSKTVPLMRDKA